MDIAWFGGNHHAPALRFAHIVAKRLRNRVERQRSLDEPADKIQTAHLLLPIGAYRSKCLAHGRTMVDRDNPVSRFSDIIIPAKLLAQRLTYFPTQAC